LIPTVEGDEKAPQPVFWPMEVRTSFFNITVSFTGAKAFSADASKDPFRQTVVPHHNGFFPLSPKGWLLDPRRPR